MVTTNEHNIWSVEEVVNELDMLTADNLTLKEELKFKRVAKTDDFVAAVTLLNPFNLKD